MNTLLLSLQMFQKFLFFHEHITIVYIIVSKFFIFLQTHYNCIHNCFKIFYFFMKTLLLSLQMFQNFLFFHEIITIVTIKECL